MAENILVNELRTVFDKNDCQIIDVREVFEYQAVRIPNSKLVPLSEFEEKIIEINKNQPAYFLCGIGKRAQKAAEYLESKGYSNLFVIEGGIKAWIEAGYPTESG